VHFDEESLIVEVPVKDCAPVRLFKALVVVGSEDWPWVAGFSGSAIKGVFSCRFSKVLMDFSSSWTVSTSVWAWLAWDIEGAGCFNHLVYVYLCYLNFRGLWAQPGDIHVK